MIHRHTLPRVVPVIVLVSSMTLASEVSPGASSRVRASAQILQDDALHQRVLGELAIFTNWLQQHGVRGYVGEFGWPDDLRGDSAQWNALAARWLDAADAASLWGTYWATGEWWGGTYILGAYEDRSPPLSVETANTQAPVLEAHPST